MGLFSNKNKDEKEVVFDVMTLNSLYYQVMSKKYAVELKDSYNELMAGAEKNKGTAIDMILTYASIHAATEAELPEAIDYLARLSPKGTYNPALEKIPAAFEKLVQSENKEIKEQIVDAYSNYICNETDETALKNYITSMKSVADQKKNNQNIPLRHAAIDGLIDLKETKKFSKEDLGYLLEAFLPSLTDNASPDGKKSVAAKVAEQVVDILSDETLPPKYVETGQIVRQSLNGVKQPHILMKLAEAQDLRDDAMDKVIKNSTETAQSFLSVLKGNEEFFKKLPKRETLAVSLIEIYQENVSDFLSKNEALRQEVVTADLRINEYFEESKEEMIEPKSKGAQEPSEAVKKETTRIKNELN